MVRTLISLDEKDKSWLDRKARQSRVSMADVVRQAIRAYREKEGSRNTAKGLLESGVVGLWKGRRDSSREASLARSLRLGLEKRAGHR